MATTQRSTVVGVFEDRDQARRAVEELKRMGFRDDQIGVVSHDPDRKEGTETTDDTATHVGGGAAIGAAAGAGVGALWALGIAAGLLPGIGPVIAGGILASVLASAAGTAAVGGIAGALIGLGIPESEANYYEEEFKGGRTIVTVRADGRFNEAEALLRRYGAYNRSNAPAAATATKATAAPRQAANVPSTTTTNQEQKVRLHEEQLHARKESVPAGEVRAHKEVKTEQQSFEVPVQREELVIERHPATGHPAGPAGIHSGEEVRIPLKEEKVRLEKDVVAKQDVTIGKKKVQDTQRVSGTVRKEELKVEGKTDVAAGNPRTDDKGCAPGQRTTSK